MFSTFLGPIAKEVHGSEKNRPRELHAVCVVMMFSGYKSKPREGVTSVSSL